MVMKLVFLSGTLVRVPFEYDPCIASVKRLVLLDIMGKDNCP